MDKYDNNFTPIANFTMGCGNRIVKFKKHKKTRGFF
jgi:hypothetical protein